MSNIARLEKSLQRLNLLLEPEPKLLNELKAVKQNLDGLYYDELKSVASQIIATLRRM